MQDLDERKHVFLICAEFEVKKTSVSSFYKENNFKPCLTKQFLNMFKLWCERGILVWYSVALFIRWLTGHNIEELSWADLR